jgi:hypothetical protein
MWVRGLGVDMTPAPCERHAASAGLCDRVLTFIRSLVRLCPLTLAHRFLRIAMRSSRGDQCTVHTTHTTYIDDVHYVMYT